MACSACQLRRNQRSGTVLFLVTVVLGLVTLAAIGFTMSMRNANMSAHLQADQTQVQQIGESAIEYINALAKMSRSERDAWGGMRRNGQLFRDIRVDWDLYGERHGRFCILSPTYTEDSSIPQFEFGLVPAGSKLSLRALMRWERRNPGAGREALMKLPGMTTEVADSILDWLDEDDVKREFGEETGFYRSKDPPRNAANTVPPHIGELQAVRGVNAFTLLGHQDGIFFAVDPNLGDVSSSTASPSTLPRAASGTTGGLQGGDGAWNIEAPPWAHYLTARTAQRNESYDGMPRIFLNDSNLRRLYSQLQQTFDARIASFVVALRRFGPSESSSDASSNTPPPDALRGSAQYRIRSVYDLVDAVVAIPRNGESSPDRFRSPFSESDIVSLTRFTQFADRVTVRPSPRLYGQVDIMHAPRLVLEMIPGFTSEIVDQIIDNRDEPTVDGLPRVHAAWLLEEQIVSLETMRLVARDITVGGDIFEAQVVAMYDATSPWFRAEVVIDGTSSMSQPLYYRDLRRLGRGFEFSNLIPPTASFASKSAPLNTSSSSSTGTDMGTFQVPPTPAGSSMTSSSPR